MAKKFFTVCRQSRKYRVFLEDVGHITKRIRKARPAIPAFDSIDQHLMESVLEFEEISETPSLPEVPVQLE